MCPAAHYVRYPHELPPLIVLLDLAIKESCDPLAEMRGQGVEIVVEAITGEDRDAAGGQPLPQIVDDRMRSILGA